MDQWNYLRSVQQAGNQGYSPEILSQRAMAISAENAAYNQQAYGHQHAYEQQVLLLRQQQALQAQQPQSVAALRQGTTATALDAGGRAADYFPGRVSEMNPPSQKYAAFMRDVAEADVGLLGPRPIVGSGGRGLEDLMYGQGEAHAGYGVSLPPGRDYSSGKGPVGGVSWDAGLGGSVGSQIDRPSNGSSRFDLVVQAMDLRRERKKAREHERRRRNRTPIKSPPRVRKEPSFSRRGVRKISPPRRPLHRHVSPVKERRREYNCKIKPYSLVEVERDFTSLFSRYSRLSIAPEFSKLVVNWSKEDFDFSLQTPVSFEHDAVVEDESAPKESSSKSSDKAAGCMKLEKGSTIWNSKVILMSGMSENAIPELASDRTLHMHNALKFAVLCKDHTALAAGGAWDRVIDGGDPATDQSALIRTAVRCFKEATQLDLASCKRWSRFVEVHYDRRDELGRPNHKEITVIFLPDLSTCLPPFESWKVQYLEHKKARLERKRESVARKEKKEKASDKKDVTKGSSNGSKDENEYNSADTDMKEKEENKDTCKSSKGEKKKENSENKEVEKKDENKEEEVKKTEKKDKKVTEEKKTEEKKDEKDIEEKKVEKNKDDGTEEKNLEKIKDEKDTKEKKAEKKKYENNTEDKKAEKKKDEKMGTEKKKDENETEQNVDKKKYEDNKHEKKKGKENEERKDGKKEENKNKVGKHDEAKDGDDGVKTKDDRRAQSKDKDSRDVAEAKGKPFRGKNDEEKIDEVPPYPGFFLTTKCSKDSKTRSMVLSLDGLLDYHKKVSKREATFELCLFAEVFQEMLQHQMGSQILASLEALRQMVIKERENRKRSRESEYKREKEGEGQPTQKRSKDDSVDSKHEKDEKDESKKDADGKSEKVEKEEKSDKEKKGERDEKIAEKGDTKDEKMEEKVEQVDEKGEEIEEQEVEEEEEPEEGEEEEAEEEEEEEEEEDGVELADEEEEPEEEEDGEELAEEEEEPEEEEEAEAMEAESGEPLPNGEASPSHQVVQKNKKSSSEKETSSSEKDVNKVGKDADVEMEDAPVPKESPQEETKKDQKLDKDVKLTVGVKKTVINKELLKAYQYFDRNRVGYLKADDMRRLLHSLGKFLSHTDVHELVGRAVNKSNKTPGDERIFYTNLVSMDLEL